MDDSGLKLLQAVEALHAEVRAMRKEASEDRLAREVLAQKNHAGAERQARYRERVSLRDSDGKRNSDVTVLHNGDVTPGVVKALDLALKLDDQEKIPVLRNGDAGDVTPKPTAAAWEAYTAAFVGRYGVKPVRNATTNSQMAQLVKRLGAEAPEVAGFYVAHPLAWYAQKQHPVGLLLNDAEALRTQWARGEATTATGARMAERSAENVGSWAKHLKGKA